MIISNGVNITSERNVKNLLKRYKIRPSKKLGQNFLVDKKTVKKIIQAADLKSNDIVLEIGPGLGILTAELSKRVKTVIAVEKDPKMTVILRETLKGLNNVEIIQEDILKISNFQFPISKLRRKTLNQSPEGEQVPYETGKHATRQASSLQGRQIPNIKSQILKKYKIVANLPYYITSPVIRKFLEAENLPKEMILTVQREVAQRICSKPPNMNLLAISVQFYAKPEIISYLSKKSFWPQPKVDSSIIKITPRTKSTFSTAVENVDRKEFKKRFFKIVRAGFSQPRKQLLNNLSRLDPSFAKAMAGKQGCLLRRSDYEGRVNGQAKKLNKEEIKSWLLKNKIQPGQRAETLEVRDWINLTKLR